MFLLDHKVLSEKIHYSADQSVISGWKCTFQHVLVVWTHLIQVSGQSFLETFGNSEPGVVRLWIPSERSSLVLDFLTDLTSADSHVGFVKQMAALQTLWTCHVKHFGVCRFYTFSFCHLHRERHVQMTGRGRSWCSV